MVVLDNGVLPFPVDGFPDVINISFALFPHNSHDLEFSIGQFGQ